MDNSIVDELLGLATDTITQNIVTWRGKQYVTAGKVPYHSIWIRDAAHCSRALVQLGRSQVVENLLDLYFDFRTEDGSTGPKGLDTMWLEYRVVRASIRKVLCLPRKQLPFHPDKPLKPLYQDSRGSRPIDSNLTILWSAVELAKVDSGLEYVRKRRHDLLKLFQYYDGFKDATTGLILQPSYSDWQDSQKRTGATFLTNLMYYFVAREFRRTLAFEEFITEDQLREHARRIKDSFWVKDTGLFQSLAQGPQVSLDGNLLALLWGFLEDPTEASELWKRLRESDLWQGKADSKGDEDTGYPGFCTFPNYPPGSATYQVRLAGLGHYHDSQYWSWLMGLAGEVCYRQGDTEEGDRIAGLLLSLAKRDGGVAEVYQHKHGFPMTDCFLFKSEYPFSWGGAYVVTMLLEKKRGQGVLA